MYIVNKHDFEVDLVDLTILVVSWIRILSWIWWIVISELWWSFVAFIVVFRSSWTFITILKTCSIVPRLFSYRLLLATLQNWMVFSQFFHWIILATSSATCTVKIVNKNWRQSVVYGSSGGSGDGGSSTELHIHRADTRELTAKSSWFCHLLHVSLVGVVAVSYGARRAGTNQPPAASNNARTPRPQQPPSTHTVLCLGYVVVCSLSVHYHASAWL